MQFQLASNAYPNGTILLLGISYPGLTEPSKDATRGRTQPKVFTYAFLKAGNLWYGTGGAKVPQAAGWLAVVRWLDKDNRSVEWAKVVVETTDLWTKQDAPVKVESVIDADYMERRANREALEPGLG